jgi:hypothetical protein
MRTALTDVLGLDFPLVAFSHCRDVVAAVTNSGGFGMLGAVRFTPDQRRQLTVCAGPVNSRKDVNDGCAAQSGHRRNIRVPVPE